MPGGSGRAAGAEVSWVPGAGLEDDANGGELLLERTAAGVLGDHPLEGSFELVPEPGQVLGGHLVQRALRPGLAGIGGHSLSWRRSAARRWIAPSAGSGGLSSWGRARAG
ncbi:MAG: hypothetical protein ACRDPD_25320 [Streptosporangiaceae bacterium]